MGLQPKDSGGSAPGCSACQEELEVRFKAQGLCSPVYLPAPVGNGLCLGLPGTLTQFTWGSDQGQCSVCRSTGQPCLGWHEEGVPHICSCLLIEVRTSQPSLVPSCRLFPGGHHRPS